MPNKVSQSSGNLVVEENREDKHSNTLKQYYMVFSWSSASHYLHTPHLGSPFNVRKKTDE